MVELNYTPNLIDHIFFQIRKMMAALDKDKSGNIDYEEFLEAVRAKKI